MREHLFANYTPQPRWQHRLSDEDIALLEWLENAACEMAEGGDDAASKLAGSVYRILHHVAVPTCRKHHPEWGEIPAPTLSTSPTPAPPALGGEG